MIAKVVLIGIVLVFLILLLLTVLLMIFPLFFAKKNKQKAQELKSDNTNTKNVISDDITKNNDTDEYTIISVITAAIASYRQSVGESNDLSSFKVVAFRKAKRR